MGAPRKYQPCTKTCEACGGEFEATTAYAITKQRFCDRSCRSQVIGNGRKVERTERDCLNCGKTMEVLPCHFKTKKFCSYACGNSYNQQGERNSQWKGGDARGKYWKKKARERDNFTCQFPGCHIQHKGKGTHAHHKIPRSVDGADELENLITMCSKHHREMEGRLLKALMELHPESTRTVVAAIYAVN